MPSQYLMSDLVTRCLRRANKEGDGSIGPIEVKALVSEQYGEMCSVVNLTGSRYFETSTDFTTAGLAYIAEPADHLSTVDVIERVLDTAGRLRRLRPISAQERSYWAGKTGHARGWEFANRQINLYPTPPSGDVYRLRYIPQPPELTVYADGTNVDVVNPHGLAFLIWGTAIKILSKSGGDVQLAITEREGARAQLSEWASLRAFNEPQRTYVDDDDDDGPYYDGEYWYDR
jgi:hypothetical protein